MNKSYPNAMKTIKSLKLFCINSNDPNDVRNEMERKGYKDHFPMSHLSVGNFLIRDDLASRVFKVLDQGLVQRHFLTLDQKKLEDLIDIIQLYHLLGRICLMKCQIMQSLGETANCEKWAHLHFLIVHDLHHHFRTMEETIGAFFEGKQEGYVSFQRTIFLGLDE